MYVQTTKPFSNPSSHFPSPIQVNPSEKIHLLHEPLCRSVHTVNILNGKDVLWQQQNTLLFAHPALTCDFFSEFEETNTMWAITTMTTQCTCALFSEQDAGFLLHDEVSDYHYFNPSRILISKINFQRYISQLWTSFLFERKWAYTVQF